MNENNELNNVEPTVETPVTPEVTQPAAPEVTPELTQPEVPATPEVAAAPEVAAPAETPAAPVEEAPAEAPATPVAETPAAPAETPAPVAEDPAMAVPAEAPKKKSHAGILIAIALLLAIFAVVYYMFLRKEPEPTPAPVETPVENTTPVAEDTTKYVGAYTAKALEGDSHDENYDYEYYLYLTSDNTFSFGRVTEGDNSVGTYEVKEGKLNLNTTVVYSTDCFTAKTDQTVLTINEDGTITDTEKNVTYTKKETLDASDEDTMKKIVTNPVDGTTPEGATEPLKACAN